MSLAKKRDILDSIWSVFTSFGFYEVEKEEGEKYCVFEKDIVKAVNGGINTDKSKAELVALSIETAIANGLDNFEVSIKDNNIFELLELFGFENMIKLDKNVSGFSAVSNGIEFACGEFTKNIQKCTFCVDKFIKALEKEGAYITDSDVSASLIYAENNAEGLAYDIAYNLRVNGCIVEFYNENKPIEDAEEYAKNKNISCILRVYPDGKLLIKDFIKNEITQTTAFDFLGYYEDDEECDCGCDHDHEHHHHHGDGCDCCGH